MARCNMSIERCLGVIFTESTAEITFFFPVRGASGIHYYLYHLHSTHKGQVLIRIMHILHKVLHDYLQPQRSTTGCVVPVV